MSLQNLSKDILLKADLEKENLLKKLEEEKSKLEHEQEVEFERYKQSMISKYERESSSLKFDILGKYNQQAKSVVLDAKAKIITEVFNQAQEKILSFSKKEKEDILLKLLKLAKEVLNYDVVICSKADNTFVKSKVDKKIKLSVVENLNGLKFEANNGKEVLDLSFEKLFQDLFEESQEEVQKILFN